MRKKSGLTFVEQATILRNPNPERFRGTFKVLRMFWRNSERKEEVSLKQYGVHRMLTLNSLFVMYFFIYFSVFSISNILYQ